MDPKTGEVVESARANVPEDLAPDELTAAKAIELMETAAPEERVLGADPHTGHTVVAKNGRYGAYVTEIIPEPTAEQLANAPVEYYKNGKPKPPKKPVKAKPRTGSLFASMSVDTVTLDEALQLMSLPRVLGQDAEGNPITVQNGRFGPYLKKGTDSRSIGSEEEIFTITLEQALEIYSQPKQRGARAAVPPLAEFGPDPVSEKNIVVKEGRFGPYITDGVTNITVPRSHLPGGTHPGTGDRTACREARQGPGQAHDDGTQGSGEEEGSRQEVALCLRTRAGRDRVGT